MGGTKLRTSFSVQRWQPAKKVKGTAVLEESRGVLCGKLRRQALYDRAAQLARSAGHSDRAGRMIPTATYFHGCDASSSGWAGFTIVTSIVLAWLPLLLYEEDS